MSGWCWDMRDEPYEGEGEGEGEDRVSTEPPLGTLGPQSWGLPTAPVPQRVVQ